MKIKSPFRLLFICLLSFISITYSQESIWIQYTHVEKITTLVEEGNYIWAATDVGLYQVEKTSLESICYNNANSDLPCNNVEVLAVDERNGQVWIGMWLNGVVRPSVSLWANRPSRDI